MMPAMVEEERTGEFYTTSEVARILRLSPSRVRALAAAGKLEAERDESGSWRFPAGSGVEENKWKKNLTFLRKI
jgi:excisionase family DNA binding protein